MRGCGGKAAWMALVVGTAAVLSLGAAGALQADPGRKLDPIPRLGKPKLDSRLAGLAPGGAPVRVVVVPAGDQAAARTAVTAAGGTVEAETSGLIQAQVPIPALERTAADDRVAELRPPFQPAAQATGEGVGLAHADVWQAAGVNG